MCSAGNRFGPISDHLVCFAYLWLTESCDNHGFRILRSLSCCCRAAAPSVGPAIISAGSPHLDHESIALHQVARGRDQELISEDKRHHVTVNRTHGADTENAGIGIVISNASAGAYHRIISMDPSGAAAQTGMIREFV